MGVKGRNWRLSIDVLMSTRRERGRESGRGKSEWSELQMERREIDAALC